VTTKLVDFQFNYRKTIALNPTTRAPILDANTGKTLEVYHPTSRSSFLPRRRGVLKQKGSLIPGQTE